MRMDWCISFLWLVNYLRWTQCVHFSQLCYLGPVSSPLLGSFSSLEDEEVGLPVICMGPFISFPRQTAHTGRTTTITTNSNSIAPEEMPQGSDVARSVRVERLWRGSAEEFEDVYSYPLFLGTEDQYSEDARSKWHSGAKERNHLPLVWTSLVAQTVKRLSTMRETWVWSLGWEDPLEKEMAVHSSTLASKIPWTEEPGRLYSPWGRRVGHDWATSLEIRRDFMSVENKWGSSGVPVCLIFGRVFYPVLNRQAPGLY